MRIVIDSLIGLMLVAALAVAWFMYRGEQRNQQEIDTVRLALGELDEKTDYHTALESAEQGRDALIVQIQEAWFGEAKPVNVLLDASHPWIDLAPPGDLGVHPPDPVVTRPDQAGFWYNPTVGVFRARVIPQASEAKTLDLYNQVNATILPEFDPLPDHSRTPIAHGTDKAPALQYASMANRTWAKFPADGDSNTSIHRSNESSISIDAPVESQSPDSPSDEPVEQTGLESAEVVESPDQKIQSNQRRPKLGH